jgi:hypothetical protein
MQKYQNHTYEKGLSLFELVIVLIILGLIAAAWLGYGHLKKASRIKTVIADLEEYYQATNTFKETYEYFPGDIPNATAYWFNDSQCPGPDCCTGVAYRAGECNGNGNQQVGWGGGTPDSNESLRAWQHLVLAGVLPGKYDGIGGEALPNVNVPESKAGGIGYDFHYGPVGNNEERNYIGVGAYNKGGPLKKAVLTPSEAYNIDNKIDDGYPMKGNFLSSDGVDTDNCTKGFVSESSVYEVTKNTPECISHRNIDKQVPIEK